MPKSEVFNMDCVEGMKQYPDKYFDLAIVDPPYGIGAGNGTGRSIRVAIEKGKFKGGNWDSEIPSEEYFTELFRVSKYQIIWGGNYFHNLHLEGVIVWYKKGSGNFKEGEFAKTSINTFKVFGYSRADAYINCGDVKIHPTQKPTKLYDWILSNYAKPNDLILDTHLGSGSSRIAAYNMGFDFTGFELDEDYFNAAEKRFKEQTAQLNIFTEQNIST